MPSAIAAADADAGRSAVLRGAMLVEGVQHLVGRPAQRWMMQRPQAGLIGNKARIVGDHGGLAS